MKTVRLKMAVLFGVLMSLISISLAVTTFFTSERSLVNETMHSMENLAIQAGNAVSAKLESHINAMEALTFCEVLSKANPNEDTILKLLQNEVARGNYLHMAFVDSNGDALYEDGTRKSLKEQENYQKSIGGEVVISEPILTGKGELIMIYSIPIKRDNQIVGALWAERNGLELGELVGETNSSATGTAFIINSSGKTIAHSDDVIMQNLLDTLAVNLLAQGEKSPDAISSATEEPDGVSSATVSQENAENIIGYTHFAKLLEAMAAGEIGNGEYEYNGIEKIMGYAPIGNFGWSIGLEINRDIALKSIENMLLNFIVLGVIFLVITIVIVYLAAKKMSQPLEYLTDISYQMSMGDYTVGPEDSYKNRKDEIGRLSVAFQAITDSTSALLRENQDISKQMTETSQKLDYMIQQFTLMMRDITSAIEQVANANMEQAEGTQVGTYRLQEMEELMELELQHMQGLHDSSEEVEKLKEEGFTILEDLAVKTSENSNLTEEIHQVFRETSESAGKIADISAMIGDITKQTKLLALNASIEAARAGENGKGFSVVANEVEHLAEAADRLSKEIAGVVEELSEKSLSSMSKMDHITKTVSVQGESVEMTVSKFKGIAGAIETTRNNIQILKDTIHSMGEKKDEIVKIIMDLSATSEENASGTEEVSVSVQEQSAYLEQIATLSKGLADTAEHLNNSIGKYKF